MSGEELYQFYSHFNFNAEQWKQAAERFIALKKSLDEAYSEDESIDHDALSYNFERCEVCERIDELDGYAEEFAKEFAPIWAGKALEES